MRFEKQFPRFHYVNIGAASQENRIFAYAKTKAQISFAVTAKLISAFVFATQIVHFLFLLNPKFQASMLLLGLYMSVCVRPGRKPRRPVFSRRGSILICILRNYLVISHCLLSCCFMVIFIYLFINLFIYYFIFFIYS